jgi:methenyltetrahydrofolate cyclohydrolase
VSDLPFRNEPLGRFLELIASDRPAPGGGAAAAVTAALAAGLVAMVARFSERQVEDAAQMAAQADRLRARAVELADEDAQAYQNVLAAYRLPKDDEQRVDRIATALQRAAEVPLEIARIGAEGVTMARRLADAGNPNLRGDAVIAAQLAEAAVRGGVELVELNVQLGGLRGDWLDRTAECLSAVTAVAR